MKDYVCSVCKTVVQQEAFPAHWVQVSEVEINGLRMYEKVSEIEVYETFHIPNKIVKHYCSSNCALNYYKQSLELFLREVKPVAPPADRPMHY